MALNDKKILLLIEDYTLRTKVVETLKPLVRILLEARNDADAHKKASNQEFDAVIMRTATPLIGDPKRFFEQAKSLETMQRAYWIVLGKDCENESYIITNDRLKFIADPSDGVELIKILEGLMYTPSKGQLNINDVTFVNPSILAVISVVEQMGKMKLERGTPFLRQKGAKRNLATDVSGIVAMNADRFQGSLSISFEEKAALAIYEKMSGESVAEINDDVKDCVVELTNIIFGDAKKNWNSSGHTIQTALPTGIAGKNHEVPHLVEGIGIIIPFESPSGKIYVECVMAPR